MNIHPLTINDMLITSLVVSLADNTFHIQLSQIHRVPSVNTMLCKTLTIEIMNPYLAITDNEQYYTRPVDMDIMKCLISRDTAAPYSGGVFLIQRQTVKQLVDPLEQNIGCWRQAFIQPTAGPHQVWGKTAMLCLLWVLWGSMCMLRTCEKLHRGVGLAELCGDVRLV